MAASTPKHRREQPDPPGSIYAKRGRIYWQGRLPGEEKFRPRAIKPPGASRALPDTPANRDIAKLVIWNWHKQASRDPDAEVLTVADLVAAYNDHAGTYYRRPDGSATGEAQSVDYATRPLVSDHGSLPADMLAADLSKFRPG